MGKKVNTTRYIRPNQFFPWDFSSYEKVIKDNLYGVTVEFEIDFGCKFVTANWSVCNGDNFSREVGKSIAAMNNQQFEFNYSWAEDKGSLVDGLIHAIRFEYPEEMKEFPYTFETILEFFIKAGRLVENV